MDPECSATFCTNSITSHLNFLGKGNELVLKTMISPKQIKSSLFRDLEVNELEDDNFMNLPKACTQMSILLKEQKAYFPAKGH